MFAAENSPRVKDKKDEVVKSGEVRCLQYIFKKRADFSIKIKIKERKNG